VSGPAATVAGAEGWEPEAGRANGSPAGELRGDGHGAVGLGGAFIWLTFIVIPLVDALTPGHHGLPTAVDVICAIAVAASYVALVFLWRTRPQESTARPGELVLLAVLYVFATGLTLADQSGWGFLFTYCAAVGVLVLGLRWRFLVVIGSAGMGAACSAIAGANGGGVLGIALSTAGVGLLMMVMAALRTRNVELRQARAELARVAVAQERQRFARDRPEEAGREIAGVEAVARAALEEVREAVSGYRDLTLEGELAGARMALTAAGIETTVAREAETIERPVETVLAWAVREAATNVIRHSRASHCTFRLRAAAEAIELEVRDDGVGDALGAGNLRGGPGHGLAGLAERVRTVGGALEAGAAGDGGYRLRLRIPAGEGAA
jgi:two-component system sensor histidine kinase DesK